MSVRVAINGFGRTGRAAFRAAHESAADIELVAINDIADPAMLAQLLEHDTVYGPFDGIVEACSDAIVVDGIASRPRRSPIPRLPWGELGVDVVIESSGKFRTRADAAKHLEAGAEQGDHLRPCEGSGRDRRARRQLRRGLRPGAPRRHLERLLHDELPGAGRQGAPRDVRHPARPDDDGPRLHGRPAAARRPAQGPIAGHALRPQSRPDDDRRRQGARARHPGARGQARTATRSACRFRPARSST